jgi:mitochondrial fission protein ELM1
MVNNLGDKIVIVYTDRTPNMVKEKVSNKLNTFINDKDVIVWDSTKEELATMDKINSYEQIIQQSSRVILTADLDYACAHALSKRYIYNEMKSL